MKADLRRYVALGLLGLLLAPLALAQQRASLSGTITDADDGSSLIGANVVLVGTTLGTASDINGRYNITGITPGTYTLRVSYIGYQESDVEVTLAAGEARTLDLTISQSGLELNTVVVTSSRREEKVLDAPASISVLTARDVESDVGTSSVAALRNTTGVDMAQTGIDRREVVLRGFNNAFSGATYILTDYRQSAVPSLGVNIYSIMPNLNLDIDHIEVVRGPGSALYGAGVDAGVVHFITKDPFSNPGTAVSISGGERSLFGIQGRHAGVVGGNVGYKVTGVYGQANDFELDPNDPIDRGQLDADGVRDNDYQKYNLNGTIEYRPTDKVSVIANGGLSRLTATVLSGAGTVQADGFGYSYGQLRLQVADFFAQVYFNKNAAGDSFVYGTDLNADGVNDPVVDRGVLYNAQAQYDLDIGDKEQLIFGFDLELTRPDTEGTILGRNEENDSISEYGVYAQSTTAITEQFDFTVALRGDYNNIVETFQVSPRAAVVFKPAPGHSLRATFNRAFSSPGTNSLFLDLLAGCLVTQSGFPPEGNCFQSTSPILIRGRGAFEGFTWARDPAFAGLPTPTGGTLGIDLVASSINPAAPGLPTPVGLPLDLVYGSVYNTLAGLGSPTILALLRQQGLFTQFPDAVALPIVEGLITQLSPANTQVGGVSPGEMRIANQSATAQDPFDTRFQRISSLTDIRPLDQTTTQTYEVGYKGVINNKVLLTLDGYYTKKENFVGPLAMETPFVFVPTLGPTANNPLGDLGLALAGGIRGNQLLAGQLQQLGFSPEQVAGIIVGLAASGLPGPQTPVAIVQPSENMQGLGPMPGLMLSYRNFGKVEFWGVDAAVQVLANENVSIFANLSIVSDDFFDNEELEETNTDLSLALNAPTFKAKVGGSYTATSGFSANLSGRYTEGFPVRSGPYIGDVESYFVLDIGAGYDFNAQVPGLRFDIGISNVLDNEHHEFIGAPRIGRIGIARLTYSM